MSDEGQASREAAVAALRGETAETKPTGSPAPAEQAEGEGIALASPGEEAAAEGEPSEKPAEEATTDGEGASPAEAKQSPGWKAYARKTQKLKAERQALDEAKAHFRAQTEAIGEQLRAAQEYEQIRSLFREDPTAALERLGASYADITNHVLKAGTPEAKIEQLERQLKAQADREQQAARQADQSRAERAFVAVATRAEAYPDLAEFTATLGEEELINNAYGVATALRDRLGHIPSDEEIAKELDQRAKLYHDKIRTRGGGHPNSPSPESDTGTGQRSKPPATRAPKTLTNNHAREAKGIPRRETDEERAQRARQMLAGLKR